MGSQDLLTRSEIDDDPSTFLHSVGEVFADFGSPVQDSGNVSYGVQIGSERVFVKTAGRPDDPEPMLDHAARVALLRNAVLVAGSCELPALPSPRNVIEAPVGPMLVYEWLDGELLGVPRPRRDDPTSSFQRFRSLPAPEIIGCLDVIYEVHRELVARGWIACDFYGGCLIYDFDHSRLGIVDLDMYRQGAFVNEMGRMFGSSRFMAPEEFERGAVIDQRTTVFTLGRAAAVFLGDGSLERAAFRGPDAMHGAIARACSTDREQRFPSVATFFDAWSRTLVV